MLNKNEYLEYSQDLQPQAVEDLVVVLLPEEIQRPDDMAYAWNPLAAESETLLAELELEFKLDDWSEAEIAGRAQSFFSQLDQLRANYVPVPSLEGFKASLVERFSARIPDGWLEAIASRAGELIEANLSLRDRMVQCVTELFPTVAEDDLLVLARPLAYAMRGSQVEPTDLALAGVRDLDWTQLSQIEQARLSLAIARVALNELESKDD
jgi:hypothetical protein